MKPSSPLLNGKSLLDERAQQLIQELNDRELKKTITLPTDDPLDPKRRKRVELTLDEMWDQPKKINETLETERQTIIDAAAHLSKSSINRIIMIGCGDSLASMIAVRSFFESLFGIACEPIQALDFAYYYYRPINEKTLVIVLSSSGATTRVVESLLLAAAMGAQTLALSNTSASALMNESDKQILVHAERKGWPTQSSTSAMAVLYQFGIELARKIRPDIATEITKLENELHETPALIAEVLKTQTDAVAALAKEEVDRHTYLFTAGGPCYASALFGAAKVKELSPDHAISISLEEYHHYNSQKSEDPMFLIAPNGPGLARALDTAREGKRVGGRVYSIISAGSELLNRASDTSFALPIMDERLTPMVYTIPVQLFAYHVAMAKFHKAENMQ